MAAQPRTTVLGGLGGPAGYGEIAVPRSDDTALRVDLSLVFPDGIDYFGSRLTARQALVGTNGTLAFTGASVGYPTAGNAGLRQDVIAPFWGDVDTRLDGEGAESGGIWVDLDAGRGIATITWDDVGVYRRDATVTNTFQMQLVDRSDGDFDIVFRYEHIGWTQGTSVLDHDLATLPQSAGNTGMPGLWVYEMRDGKPTAGVPPPEPDPPDPPDPEPESGLNITGTPDVDSLDGSPRNDTIVGLAGNDRLRGGDGNDTINGGDGADILVGGDGDDLLIGGDSVLDLSDRIFGGNGNDTIRGGYGNDILRGSGGDDVLIGWFGSDTLIGSDGDDALSGQALSDLLFGGDGDDFINGGFGFDRVSGGAGADKFYHLGIADHGSDWIQDYTAAEDDVLIFGGEADIDDFRVNFGATPEAGEADVQEAFIIYEGTGKVLWALVDGGAQDQIMLSLGGTDYDLLA